MLAGVGVWPNLIRPWAAPNTYSHPVVFEDRMLERSRSRTMGHAGQPLASGNPFFTTLPMLPYLATIQETLPTSFTGKGLLTEPGSPVPKLWQTPALNDGPSIVGAGAVATGFIAIP